MTTRSRKEAGDVAFWEKTGEGMLMDNFNIYPPLHGQLASAAQIRSGRFEDHSSAS